MLFRSKRMAVPMDAAAMPEDVKEKWYPNNDWHTMYWGEIVEALARV